MRLHITQRACMQLAGGWKEKDIFSSGLVTSNEHVPITDPYLCFCKHAQWKLLSLSLSPSFSLSLSLSLFLSLTHKNPKTLKED